MASSRRPQQTVLSGVGVAGSVLAAVVVTFALASSIVAYSLTSVDPLPRPSAALVLAPLGPGVTAAKPRPALRAGSDGDAGSAPAAGAVGPASASKRDRKAGAGALSRRRGRGSRAETELQHGGDGAAAAPAQPASDRAAPEPLLAPVGAAVGATGQAVDATTDSLARRLDTVTAAVGVRTEPVARTVGSAVDETGNVLRTTADGSGRAVGRLLGDSPPR